MITVLEVRIKPYQIYDQRGKVMIGAEIVVVFREYSAGPKRYALSRVNYAVDDTSGMREYHKQSFLARAKQWR